MQGYYVIETLYPGRNCWNTLWTDSSNEFINDVLPEVIKCHIFNAFNFYVSGEILIITWACSLWKYLILAIIYLRQYYSAWTSKP